MDITKPSLRMQTVVNDFLRSKISHSYKLSAFERILLTMLGSYCGNKNSCWPTYESLKNDCGMAKARLSKAIKNLEKLELISIKKEHRNNNIYSLNIDLLSSRRELNEKVSVRTSNSMSLTSELNRVSRANSNTSINTNINTKEIDSALIESKRDKNFYKSKKNQSTIYDPERESRAEKPSPILEEFMRRKEKEKLG